MAKEIERKFLVEGDSWKKGLKGKYITQGYIFFPGGVVRVRISGDDGYLAIKGRNKGIVRNEFEYKISKADAEELLHNYVPLPYIEKTRYIVEHRGRTWYVDEFHGANGGLKIAETELAEENEVIGALPKWIGREVSNDPAYYNSSLVRRPFSMWQNNLTTLPED